MLTLIYLYFLPKSHRITYPANSMIISIFDIFFYPVEIVTARKKAGLSRASAAVCLQWIFTYREVVFVTNSHRGRDSASRMGSARLGRVAWRTSRLLLLLVLQFSGSDCRSGNQIARAASFLRSFSFAAYQNEAVPFFSDIIFVLGLFQIKSKQVWMFDQNTSLFENLFLRGSTS